MSPPTFASRVFSLQLKRSATTIMVSQSIQLSLSTEKKNTVDGFKMLTEDN